MLNCADNGEIKEVNWDLMQNDLLERPDFDIEISLDSSTLKLTFDIDLEYIGLSTNGLGTTYVIDFYSFSGSNNKIDKPGNCQNRLASSFIGISNFNDYWSYSEYPYLNGEIGTNSTMSYPPPNKWHLTINSCTPINYKGIFSWSELIECIDYDGNKLISVVDNNESITLSGSLYVNVVSPIQMGVTDIGFYRSLQLIKQYFSISILKQINVLSSTGVNLFIISIIGISETNNGLFEFSILTQSADFMQLGNVNILNAPHGISISSIIITNEPSECFVGSSSTCGQIFTITIDPNSNINNNNRRRLLNCTSISYTGEYVIEFEIICRNNLSNTDLAACNAFIESNGGPLIALTVESNFVDITCIPFDEVYQIIFDGTMTFYDDNTFLIPRDDTSDPYVIDEDIIYIEVNANFPDDGSGDNYQIFGVVIDNVFVCTASNITDLSINLDQQNGNGGCLSSNIDPDGPYIIISNGQPNIQFLTQIISLQDGSSNVAQFSFLIFDTARSKIYIHVQLTLVLQNGLRRRLQIFDNNNGGSKSSQIRHFIDSTSIESSTISPTKLPSISPTKSLTIVTNTKETEKDVTNSAKNTHKLLFLLFYVLIKCQL